MCVCVCVLHVVEKEVDKVVSVMTKLHTHHASASLAISLKIFQLAASDNTEKQSNAVPLNFLSLADSLQTYKLNYTNNRIHNKLVVKLAECPKLYI